MSERLYLGSDGCSKIFRDVVSYFHLLEERFRRGPVTLVIPPLTNAEIPELKRLLTALAKTDFSTCDIELCANDLGTFSLVAEAGRTASHLMPTVGRWLSRQDTDPQLANLVTGQNVPEESAYCEEGTVLRYKEPSEELALHWATPSAFSPTTLEILRRIRGRGTVPLRIEVDATALLIAETEKVLGSLENVSVSIHGEGALISMIPCGRECDECPQKTQFLGPDRFGNSIYRTRNLIHGEQSKVSERIREYAVVDRIIDTSPRLIST